MKSKVFFQISRLFFVSYLELFGRYKQNHHPVGASIARPCHFAANATFPTTCAKTPTHHNIHTAQKFRPKFVEKFKKTCWQSMTTCGNIIKLSREGQALKKPITTACAGFAGVEKPSKKIRKNFKKFLTNGTWCCIINKLSTRTDSAAGPWKLNKTETSGTLIVGLETHVNHCQILQVIHTGRKRLCLSDYSDLTLCKWLNTIYKEFDPGSGRTLAARLTHASRTELFSLLRVLCTLPVSGNSFCEEKGI